MLSKEKLKEIVAPLVPEPEYRYTNLENTNEDAIDVPPGAELLGSGASGHVFKLNNYAIKRIVDPTGEIRNELTSWKTFSSDPTIKPYIPEYYGYTVIHNENATNDNGQDKSYLFIVQKYEPTMNLLDFLENTTSVPFDRGYPFFLNVCKGFDAIHEAGYIHRDIKSLNILIRTEEDKKSLWKRFTTSKKTSNPQPILLDFGSVCKVPCDCKSLEGTTGAYLPKNIVPYDPPPICITGSLPIMPFSFPGLVVSGSKAHITAGKVVAASV
jgi:serine/threonine protein kinase